MKPERILFITANRIGDAVLATGLLDHLLKERPNARITIACGPVAVDLFRGVPNLEKIIVLKKQKRHGHWINLWKQCVGTRWDLVVDLRNSLVSRLLLAKKKGYRPARATGRHKVIDNAEALRLDPPPSPHLWTDAEAERVADKLMPKDRPVLAIGPAANWPAKQWAIENFIQLLKNITQPGGALADASILVVAAPNERDQVAPLLASIPEDKRIDAIGHDLLGVAACLKRCRLFIGNDSGLMHMAAAVGTPTVGLFGPSLDTVYGPWGKHTRAVRTPESMDELVKRLPYPGAFHPNLMETLTLPAVEQATIELFNKTKDAA